MYVKTNSNDPTNIQVVEQFLPFINGGPAQILSPISYIIQNPILNTPIH